MLGEFIGNPASVSGQPCTMNSVMSLNMASDFVVCAISSKADGGM